MACFWKGWGRWATTAALYFSTQAFPYIHVDYNNLEGNKWITKGGKCWHEIEDARPHDLAAHMLFVFGLKEGESVHYLSAK